MSTRRQASSEPEPPNVASMKSRTSRPRLTLTWRRALAWFHAEISRMPVAQWSGSMPSLAAMASMPALAARSRAGSRAEQVRGDPAEDDVGVGDGGLGAALGVAERAGSAPADWGPTLRVPSGEIQAMEPPPAPTVTTSIIGILLG